MKGISAVIAAILMLMITMALAGVAYFYISGIFASKTTLIEAVGDADVTKPYSAPDETKCKIEWNVRNIGTATVSVSVPVAPAGGEECTTNPPASQTIAGGETKTFIAEKCTKNRNHVFKVAGPSNTVSLSAFCA